ncbi:MAG: hypothetical protein JNK67_07255 [Alphaproteobacteria bacterium]|nr:hypothetical protein [Alphaproteobacteria bacterium]
MRGCMRGLVAMLAFTSSAAALEPAPLVMLPVGTKLHQDDGGKAVVWTITESKPGAYAAERDDGISFASIGGLATPPLIYNGRHGLERQRITRGDPLAIYPLAVGRSVRFSVSGETPSKGWRWQIDHACVVTGTDRTTVRAGSFETYVVRCERVPAGMTTDQTITRYYAPSIGATVLTIVEEHRNNTKWRTELVMPPGN